jgi:hypothetical protein
MTRRSKIWLIVATLFTLVNFGGAVAAAVMGEGLHTAAHVALMVLGGYFVARITRRSRLHTAPGTPQLDQRLDHIQQSLDAVAIEIERIGESQRFATKLMAERVGKSQEQAPPASRHPSEES